MEPRQDGTCNIKLYVNHQGKKKYIKTDYHVLPAEFDKKKGIVKKSHPNHLRLNAKIGEQKRIIETQLLESGNVKMIGKAKQTSFIQFLNNYYDDHPEWFHQSQTQHSEKLQIPAYPHGPIQTETNMSMIFL